MQEPDSLFLVAFSGIRGWLVFVMNDERCGRGAACS